MNDGPAGSAGLPQRIGLRFAMSTVVTVLLTVAAVLLASAVLQRSSAATALMLLAVGLPVGLGAGLWLARSLSKPMTSMAEAAQRIGEGQLSVRAEAGRAGGAMAAMVHHFNDMAASLEANERNRKAMVAAISHELRTPLAVLQARLHAACDGIVPCDIAEMRRLLEQAEHLGHLVDDLHTLALAEAGRLPLKCRPVELLALAHETLLGHAPRLAQLGIAWQLSEQSTSAWVEADPDRLRQILSNLLDNAARHGRGGGWISVAVTRSHDGLALLTVSDAGGGRPDTVRSHLQRALGDPAQPRAPAAQGSGLGMAIVLLLARAHGGSVDVHAAQHDDRPPGLAVQLRLPLRPQGAA